MKTKNCKFCQMEIPKKATVCPNCRRSLKRSHGCLLSLLIGLFIVFGWIGFAMNLDMGVQRSISGTKDDSEYITAEEYGEIKSGMSYEEVKEIIGSDGSLSSESTGNSIKIQIYTWYGNGAAGSNANVTFTNDKVTGKAQFGLK